MNIVNVLRNRENTSDTTQITKLQTSPAFIDRLDLQAKLYGHDGCVNCLEFTSTGNVLASASDDCSVFLWNIYKSKAITSFRTPHKGNIFSVNFLPGTDNKQLVTGAADNYIYAFDLNNTEDPIFKCCCHLSRVKRIACTPELTSTFFSSSEDGCVFQIDLREPHTCNSDSKIVLIDLKRHEEFAETKAIAINPRRTEQLAIGANDAYARLYDRRMIKLMPNGSSAMTDNLSKTCVRYYCPGHIQAAADSFNKTITFVTFSPDGTELLVNYSSEQIYLFDIEKSEPPVYLNLPRLPILAEPNAKPPKNAIIDALKTSGNEFLENEKYIEAIRKYTEAIQLSPKFPVLYLNRATALMRRKYLGDFYEALRDCHTALHLDPHYIKAHFRLARALYEINQLTLSNDCLQELKRRFPSYVTDQSVKMLEQDINQALMTRATTQTSVDTSSDKMSENEMVGMIRYFSKFLLPKFQILQFWRNEARDYKRRFIGHCNTKTDIKEANYFGHDGEYIVAG